MSTALFQPRYLKEATLLAQHARRLLHRRRDVMSDVTVADIESEIGRLEHAIAERDEAGVKEKSEQLDTVFSKAQPGRADAGWRENCEVLLVAFVLAIAIRAYFLQPFKIPTGSMQPTLNGIIAKNVPANQPLPGALHQFFDSLWLGRSYVNVVSAVDDQVVDLQPVKRFGFMEYTRIVCASGHEYLVHATTRALTNPENYGGFALDPHREIRAGKPIVHGYIDTGDQVFVDKFTYNFRLPHREDVFVFNTLGIKDIEKNIGKENPEVKSQFYIKRLAGLPGDMLRIQQPDLYVNGSKPTGSNFQRVMSGVNGYRGYSNPKNYEARFLLTPDDTFTIPPKNYFALGDNSFNSADSRFWGTVPEANVVGRGLFVYWPFTRHWGPIH